MSTMFTARILAPLGEVSVMMERWEALDPAPLAVSAIEKTDTEWWVEALYGAAPDAAALKEQLGAEVHLSGVADANWVARSLEGLPPVFAGRFAVYGAHDAARVPVNKTRLCIEASLAFGSGHHGTTRGCLVAIDRLLKRPNPPRRILDLGTGTGVLALAFARALHRPVLASDIDSVAVSVAKANARANGLGPWLHAVRADGLHDATLRRRAPYDLIVANILAKPLIRLAPAIAHATTPGGRVILSGLLVTQGRQVLGAYREAGFVLHNRLIEGEWMVLELTRKGRRIAAGKAGR